MALKAVVDDLDSVDEAFRGEYVERDGKFYLDFADDSIKMHTAILPLANSLVNVKKERDKARADLTAANAKLTALPADFDVDAYNRLMADEKEREKDPNYKPGVDHTAHLQRQKQQYEQRIANMERTHAETLAAKEKEIQERDNLITKSLVDDGLNRALTEAGVTNPVHLKASRAMLKDSVKVVRDEETGERRAVVETDLGPTPIDQFVGNWAKSDEGKTFVQKPTGGGADGGKPTKSAEGNPWDPAKPNLTQQGIILKADKARAERLMRAAGKSQSEIDRTLGRNVAA